MVSRLKHEHVVELLGYCMDGSLRVLAYEYASNGSLHDILHGKCCQVFTFLSGFSSPDTTTPLVDNFLTPLHIITS